MISIPNLTPKQKVLLDVMWNIDNMEQVTAFINSLPRRDQIDAMGLLKMAIEDSEELEQGMEQWANEAKRIIDKARA